MQEFCHGNSSTIDSETRIEKWPNASVKQFLERLQRIGENKNFFVPGFTPKEMESLPKVYKGVVDQVASLEPLIARFTEYDVTVGELIVNKTSARNNLKRRFHYLTDNEIDSFFNAKLNLTKIADKINNALSLPNERDQRSRFKRSAYSNSDYSFIMKFVKIVYLDQSDSAKIDLINNLLKSHILNPTGLHTATCSDGLLNYILLKDKPELVKFKTTLCALPEDQWASLSAFANESMSFRPLLNKTNLLDWINGTVREVEQFYQDVEELTLFDSELSSLSEWAIHLPQDACLNDTISNATESTTKMPNDENPKDDDDKKQTEIEKAKRKRYSGIVKFWLKMQQTICGNNVTQDRIDAFNSEPEVNLGNVELLALNHRNLGVLLHVLYSNPKVLYSPNGTDADKVIQKANSTFATIDRISSYARIWLNVSSELRNYLSLNSTRVNLQLIKEMKQNLTDSPKLRLFLETSIRKNNKHVNDRLISNFTVLEPEDYVAKLDIIDNAACGWLRLISGISLNVFKGFKTEKELIKYTLRDSYRDNTTVFASVIFTNIRENGTLPRHVIYKIRQNSTFTQTTKLVRPKYWFPGPRTYGYYYYHMGFVWIQDIIERAIIDTFVGHDVIEPGSYLTQFPYPCYLYDKFLFIVQHVMPLLLTISWVYTVAMLVQSIVYEKEQRLKEVMKMMGLNNSVHWLAWFITVFFQTTITMGSLTIMLYQGKVLAYSNPWILFLLLEIFAMATISFSFLISVWYSKARLAAACAGIIYILTYVPSMYVAIKEEAAGDHIPFWAKSIASLFSTSAFGLGAKYFAFYEITGVGVQWNNLHISPVEGDAFNLIMALEMMIVDTILYGVLTWYIENVHPGSYGLPKPWYFPFTKSYWCGRMNAQQQSFSLMDCFRRYRGLNVTEEDQACALNNRDMTHFETEPNDCRVGVCIDNLSKRYKTGKLAVNNLSLNLFEGQITSFLGHNGAGKTTTMSILTGLFPPTSGRATVYNHDIRTDMEEIRKSLGMCPQHNVLFEELTVEEHLYFYSKLKGVPNEKINSQTEAMIKDIGLPNKRKSKVDALSGGMKRKLSVAIAFIGGSRTVILDEPTAGVDPYARRAIWDLLFKFKANRTILLSTHYMDEADILGDRIAIISNGSLRCCGSSVFLKTTFGEGYHLFMVKTCWSEEDRPLLTEAVTKFINKYVKSGYLKEDGLKELHYILPFAEVTKGSFERLFESLDQSIADLKISSYGIKDTQLEEVFMKVTQSARNASESNLDEKIDDDNNTNQSNESNRSSEAASRQIINDDDVPLDDITNWRHANDVELLTNHTAQEPTMANDQHRSLPGRGTYVVEGYKLTLQQFFAVIVKRFYYVRRNWKGLFTQILLPSVFVFIAMTVALTAPKMDDLPPLVLSPAMYFNYTRPRGNFIPFAVVDSLPPFAENSKDASPTKLSETFKLLAGVGATCILKDPFNNPSNKKELEHNLGNMFRFYESNPSCKSVFVEGLPIDKFIIKMAESKGHIKTLSNISKKRSPSLYPKCHCVKDNSGFKCDSSNVVKPDDFMSTTSDIMLNISQRNLKENSYYLYTTDEYRLHRYGAFTFGLIRDYVPTDFGANAPSMFKRLAVRNIARVWFNHKGLHSMPAYLNTLNNAILRANLPLDMGNPSAYGITVINHPMENTNGLETMDYILNGTDVLIALFIIIAMSFVPASFVVFLVQERSSKSKHLQFLSGLNPVAYWLANYIWDMCNYVIPALVCIVILKGFDIPAYVSKVNFPAVVSLFLLYGWSITPMMYPISFVFQESSAAYTFLIVINLFIGLTCIITSFLLEIFEIYGDIQLGKANHVLKNIFLFFPNYCLGRGLMDIAFNEYKNEYYLKIGQYDKIVSPFKWELTTRYLVAMAGVGLLYFCGTVLCEYGFFVGGRSCTSYRHRQNSSEDEDVAAERKRVRENGVSRDVLVVDNLTKIYITRRLGRHLAVDRSCFGVSAGECFGLLGVNGAGKTTTFKMLTADLLQTAGEIYLNGRNLREDNIVKQNIGYCPQFDALFDELTAREHLQLFCRLRGVPVKETKSVVNWALKKLDLIKLADKSSDTFSAGNKRKLSTAIALIGHPAVILLDEPTTGMDPHSRRFLWDTIYQLTKDGRCVVLTSHSMEECETLCTRMAIMVNGQLKCLGSAQHLKNRFGDGYTLIIRLKGPNYERDVRRVKRFVLDKLAGAVLKEAHYNSVQFEMKSVNLSLVFSVMEESLRDMNIIDYSVSQNTLDNVFINFVKQQTEIIEEESEVEMTSQSMDGDRIILLDDNSRFDESLLDTSAEDRRYLDSINRTRLSFSGHNAVI
ncbi:DgyrCDS9938 [Dimorphilus gyrociliatus]|uniref:DgyrCDS9938 n=1 Tax=Dimorphilus gyrociliatus TaxID=2664684 RepID=A0A7I8VYX4_9ANNE|nr:DgyrCDS9938 [Dimorphilus gyrociliatus]